MNKMNIAVKLKNVSKKYVVHHEKPTLVEKIINGVNEEFWALNNVNLEIAKGSTLGVIGPNGSGKTTLLKLITGISSPTKGKIETSGKIVSLINIDSGFHPDLTGIQNIFLNGIVLGMSKKEVDMKINEIIEFADIGRFIDLPFFTYSEGMRLRLGFAVAINSDPDILVLDEIIAVGDEKFRKKSFAKLNELIKSKKTIIISSHFMDFIRMTCKKAIYINNGNIVASGKTTAVIASYRKTINR